MVGRACLDPVASAGVDIEAMLLVEGSEQRDKQPSVFISCQRATGHLAACPARQARPSPVSRYVRSHTFVFSLSLSPCSNDDHYIHTGSIITAYCACWCCDRYNTENSDTAHLNTFDIPLYIVRSRTSWLTCRRALG